MVRQILLQGEEWMGVVGKGSSMGIDGRTTAKGRLALTPNTTQNCICVFSGWKITKRQELGGFWLNQPNRILAEGRTG